MPSLLLFILTVISEIFSMLDKRGNYHVRIF